MAPVTRPLQTTEVSGGQWGPCQSSMRGEGRGDSFPRGHHHSRSSHPPQTFCRISLALPPHSPPSSAQRPYHSSSRGVRCFCATRDMSIICGPQSTRPRALKSCSQSEHHQGKQNLFLHHFFQFMYNYTSAVSGTCVARSLTLIYARHPMTPNVFETDTWPIGPVGCFNSLTLQGTVVIRDWLLTI